MLNPTDVRLKADGRQIVEAAQLHFPLRLRVDRPAAAQALAEARRILDQLRRAADEAEFPDARLAVSEPDAGEGQGVAEFAIEQKAQQEVRLRIAFAATLRLEGAGDFWAHAAAIAAAADFLQGFASRSHGKGVEIDVQQARIVKKGASSFEKEGGEAR